MNLVFNRPVGARAGLQTPLSFINYLIESSFVEISPKHLHSQSIRARDLKFLEIVHLPPRVTRHMSCVTCHMSFVTGHMSFVTGHMSHVMCHQNKNIYMTKTKKNDTMVEFVG